MEEKSKKWSTIKKVTLGVLIGFTAGVFRSEIWSGCKFAGKSIWNLKEKIKMNK